MPFIAWLSEPNRRARRCRWLPLLIVLLCAACSNRADSPKTVPDVAFRTLDGQQLALTDRAAPVLVNFWSTSCGICLEEMPDIVALHEDYSASGVTVIAVAMPSDRPDKVLEMAESRDWPFPVAIDIDGTVLAAFEPVAGTPTRFLFDPDGQIAFKEVGRMDVARMRTRLDEMI